MLLAAFQYKIQPTVYPILSHHVPIYDFLPHTTQDNYINFWFSKDSNHYKQIGAAEGMWVSLGQQPDTLPFLLDRGWRDTRMKYFIDWDKDRESIYQLL